jgi:hypothetical protein
MASSRNKTTSLLTGPLRPQKQEYAKSIKAFPTSIPVHLLGLNRAALFAAVKPSFMTPI